MLQLKIKLASLSHSVERKVTCNGNIYNINFPTDGNRFLDITDQITIKNEFEILISILAKKIQAVNSFQEFYKLQQDAIRYFNTTINLDFHDISFKFLSETDKILSELDKCHFNDLLAIIRKAYDLFTEKLHSKFNRRIKKYLSLSTRSQTEKQQIKKLIDLIKSVSTEEQVDNEEKQQIKESFKKPKISDKEKNIQKNPKIQKKQEIKKQQIKEIENQENQQQQIKQEKKSEKKEEKKEERSAQIKHQNKHHDHHNRHKKQNEQDEWQDIKEQKIMKKKQKNNRRKHQKFDNQFIKNYDNEDNNVEQDQQQQVQNKEPLAQPSKKIQARVKGQQKLLFDKFKEKPKRQLRVILGLNGDSDDGWRQRYRPTKLPANFVKSQASIQKKQKWKPKDKKSSQKNEQIKNEKKNISVPKIDQKQEKQQKPILPQNSTKIIKIPSQGSLQKIFSFPQDGKKFILDISKQYNIRVNNNFWINITKNEIKIEKDRTGYIRMGKYTSSDQYLIEAQDLTICFDGLCNLQDGGTPFGDPKIQNFTGSPSQWFHLKELQVYTYT